MKPFVPLFVLVRNPSDPNDSEPLLSQYWKTNTIQPVQVVGSSEGITDFDSVAKSGISTSAVSVVNSSVPVKKATLRVRSVGTGSYVAVGGSARQELRMVAGQSADLWCSDLDQVFVITDSGSTAVVEVIYGY